MSLCIAEISRDIDPAERAKRVGKLTGTDPKTRDKILANIPLGRLGKPEELAALIAFLASDKADFITGQVIPFAGGWA